MNWPLFWAITLAFGVIISNIMLLKHSAKLQLPKLKPAKPDNVQHKSKELNQHQLQHDQKLNTP